MYHLFHVYTSFFSEDLLQILYGPIHKTTRYTWANLSTLSTYVNICKCVGVF
jgi:hypothetical protein